MGDLSPGAALRAWRKLAKRSQASCAAEVGVSQATWSEWETDIRPPRTRQSFAIEKMTGGLVPARLFAIEPPEAA